MYRYYRVNITQTWYHAQAFKMNSFKRLAHDSIRHDLLDILEDRQGVNTTLVSSQLPVDHWL